MSQACNTLALDGKYFKSIVHYFMMRCILIQIDENQVFSLLMLKWHKTISIKISINGRSCAPVYISKNDNDYSFETQL